MKLPCVHKLVLDGDMLSENDHPTEKHIKNGNFLLISRVLFSSCPRVGGPCWTRFPCAGLIPWPAMVMWAGRRRRRRGEVRSSGSWALSLGRSCMSGRRRWSGAGAVMSGSSGGFYNAKLVLIGPWFDKPALIGPWYAELVLIGPWHTKFALIVPWLHAMLNLLWLVHEMLNLSWLVHEMLSLPWLVAGNATRCGSQFGKLCAADFPTVATGPPFGPANRHLSANRRRPLAVALAMASPWLLSVSDCLQLSGKNSQEINIYLHGQYYIGTKDLEKLVPGVSIF